MKLTASEREILEHRLECPDNIAECLTDTEDEASSFQWSAEDIEESCERLLAGLPDLPDEPSELQRAILEDCCDGSVYVPLAESALENGDITRGEFLNVCKAAKSLEGKISRLIGREVEVSRL